MRKARKIYVGTQALLKFLILFTLLLPSIFLWEQLSAADKSWHESPIDEKKAKMGKKVFRRKGCKGCHVIGNIKKKKLRGPDLLDVTKRRNKEWLVGWLKDPKRYIKRKDPIIMAYLKQYPTKMPNLKLKDNQIEELLEYIRAESVKFNKKHGKK